MVQEKYEARLKSEERGQGKCKMDPLPLSLQIMAEY